MSKADALGASSAFGAATTARSSRRNLINSAIGGDGAGAAVTELPTTVISDNPDNPRDHLRNLDETVQNVREVGILLPIIVATTDAWLRERPERASELEGGAQYLVVDGHRRLEAARRVGVATVPVRVDNARVATDETLLEAAFVANYHRDDMTDLEEAHALKRLVEHYGSQTRASKRLGIPQNTISSKLSLLKLSPELQKDLVSGARKVEHVRNLGKLSPEEQKAKADERAEAARETESPPKSQELPADAKLPKQAGGTTPSASGAAPAREVVEPTGGGSTERSSLSADNKTGVGDDNWDSSGSAEVGRPAATGTSPTIPLAQSTSLLPVEFRQRVMTASQNDVAELADVLGQNLPADLLDLLVKELRAWMK